MSRITLFFTLLEIESDLESIESNAQNDIRYLEIHPHTFQKLSGP